MTRQYDPERVWLTADVPRDVGAAFAAAARKRHRTARAQLRALVEQLVEHDRAQDPARGDELTGAAA